MGMRSESRQHHGERHCRVGGVSFRDSASVLMANHPHQNRVTAALRSLLREELNLALVGRERDIASGCWT